jgi:hypothetical protein
VHALIANDPTPRRSAAELLECRDWCVGSHAGEDDAIRAGRKAARGGGEFEWRSPKVEQKRRAHALNRSLKKPARVAPMRQWLRESPYSKRPNWPVWLLEVSVGRVHECAIVGVINATRKLSFQSLPFSWHGRDSLVLMMMIQT